MDLFPDEEAATRWFEAQVWPRARRCGHCRGQVTSALPNAKPMPYWCSACRSYFSVRTGTALERSKVPLQKWGFAIYLELTSLKGVSSMKLHRDIGVTQSTAWFLLHRIREAWSAGAAPASFAGPVEVDETYFGGKRRNMSKAKREGLTGRGPVGKTAVVGVKDRATKRVAAKVVRSTDKETLQGFVQDQVDSEATVYTDEAAAYASLPFRHETVQHSVREYVRGQAHTNGVESFWATLQRAHECTFHKISPKHLNRYVQQFAGKHNLRDEDTRAQMTALAAGLVGKRLLYRDLIAANGLSAGARG